MRSSTIRIPVAVTLAVAFAALAGCASLPPAPKAATPAPAAVEPTHVGTIVFDMGHGEIFGAEDTSRLGQSQAVERMKKAGFEVVVNRAPIDGTTLQNASGLVLAGPMSPLTKGEYAVITSFVERGGTVLLTIHVPFPVFAVPAHWGLPVDPFVIQSQRPVSPTDSGVLVADEIVDSELTRGVRGVFVLSGWPVNAASPDARIVVKTGKGAWLDRNRNRSLDATEGADLGVVGVTRIGKGYVVVSGDDAVFANVGIGAQDNAVLLDNILRLVSSARDV